MKNNMLQNLETVRKKGAASGQTGRQPRKNSCT